MRADIHIISDIVYMWNPYEITWYLKIYVVDFEVAQTFFDWKGRRNWCAYWMWFPLIENQISKFVRSAMSERKKMQILMWCADNMSHELRVRAVEFISQRICITITEIKTSFRRDFIPIRVNYTIYNGKQSNFLSKDLIKNNKK